MMTPVQTASDAFAEYRQTLAQMRVDCGAVYQRPIGLGEPPPGLIHMETLSMWARQEILTDLFPPEVVTDCAICERPGDFSCFSVTAPWDRERPQRHVHICPECVREESLGEPIGTKFSTCEVR